VNPQMVLKSGGPTSVILIRLAVGAVLLSGGLGRIRPRLNATVNRCWSGS
jgi:hypothetical protein